MTTGENYNLKELKIDEAVPHTKNFRVYKYKNPKTNRFVKILRCDHEGCEMYFRKWHNFFDHLRVHTGERPFVCPHNDCRQSFTQKANLNKHLDIHKRKKKLQCPKCSKVFISIYLQRVNYP
jgi:uncharacterized Zn-finger protein